ncbi:unnamed protein product [Ranitomeya imitator]|uniref:C2H2-type domain-containing protein n=1 Tax=Ranitomeya imitator TaxID=111125 RepID=A0ABN9M5L8_9NEOB|nr:unnamed protein product [Ranitomeya imitator]
MAAMKQRVKKYGSRRRNPPERCPRPLYPQDCPEENHNIPEDHQGEDLLDIKVEVIHGAQEAIAIWAGQNDGSRRRNPPERCPRPLYPQDCPEENQNVLEKHQVDDAGPLTGSVYGGTVLIEVIGEDLTKNKVKNETEEEAMTRGDQPCVSDGKEEIPIHVSSGNPCENNGLSLNCKEEDIRKQSNGENLITLHGPPRLHSISLPYNPPNHEEPSPEQSHIVTTIPGDKVDSRFQCDKQLPKSSDFLTQRKHKGKKPYSCSEFIKCFPNKSKLIRQERIHSGEKPFSSLECGKSYTETPSLIRHQRIHTAMTPYPRSECGKCLTDESKFVRHQRIHTGQKPFTCSECGKCFTYKRYLTKHQRTHTGEKPFSCLECMKAFTNKSDLVKHQRTHTGEKPFSCLECGKSFTDQWNLIIHQRIHTGEKPFSCSECGKCFTDKRYLTKHQRIHTGEKTIFMFGMYEGLHK